MQVFHRAIPLAGEDIRQHTEGEIDTGVQLFLFGARGAAKNEIGHQLAVTRVADAKPQTVKAIVIAELRDDVAQAVVPTVPAAQFELGDAGGRSSSSWATRIACGGMRKKFAIAATD